MTQMMTRVAATLKAAVTIPVSYYYPATGAQLPCVSWYEIENRVQAQADGKEHLTEYAYVVDVWSLSAYENATQAVHIDAAMATLGFRRVYAQDMFEVETKIHHKTMRYRALCAPDGVIYQ